MQGVFSLLGILLVLLLVLGGSYLFTRWAGMGLAGRFGLSGAGRIRVLERVSLGRDQLFRLQTDTFYLAGLPPDSPCWPN